MKEIDVNLINARIKESKLITDDNIDALVHALVDIKESTEKIYNSLLPQLCGSQNNSETLQDLLWSIREEFRHIEYHIQDSGINDI